MEAKWSQLDYRDSKRLFNSLSAKKIDEKRTLREESFIAMDLQDLVRT